MADYNVHCIHDRGNKISKLHIKLLKNKTRNIQIYKHTKHNATLINYCVTM